MHLVSGRYASYWISVLLLSTMKLRQGNVLHLSVILFTGGVSASGIHWDTPCLGRHPPGRHPQADTPLADIPPGQTLPGGRADTPPEVSPADGTHPTGMHSCLQIFLINSSN